jgi:elongation factor P--(R)-beta-lysine ligase
MINDFLPTASWENLQLRADLLRRVREFFFARGFLEVDTPILSADTVVDRHLDPFYLDLYSSPGKKPLQMYLQTSPEFAMKRLLAAGAKAIYQISKVFRQGEQGPLHNPEFTMVEWYRVGDGMDEGMRLTGEFAEATLNRGPARRISFRQAFLEYAGIDPFSTGTAEIISFARQKGIPSPESLKEDDRDGWLDLLLVELVQPKLGLDCPVLLYDFPASQAALSRIREGSPPLAERFELYVSGMELANGYNELVDADELLRRNRETNCLRAAEGNPPLPEQSRMLNAMRSGLPQAAGVALGFDRLVMLAAGAKNISEVIAFPFDRA